MWQFAQLTTLQPQQVYVNGAPLHVPQAALRMPYTTSVLTTMSGIRYTKAAIQVSSGLRQQYQCYMLFQVVHLAGVSMYNLDTYSGIV